MPPRALHARFNASIDAIRLLDALSREHSQDAVYAAGAACLVAAALVLLVRQRPAPALAPAPDTSGR
jgi:hypothetical protein